MARLGDLSSEHNIWGSFGDFVGGTLNPTLSFLALISLLLTIILQSSELKATREEIELSRIAQQKSETALKEQAITLERQRFEGTFFQLLNLHQEIVNSISEKHTSSLQPKSNNHGRECFKIFYQDFKQIVNITTIKKVKPNHEIFDSEQNLNSSQIKKVNELKKEVKNINNCYLEFYKSHQSIIGHYFRNMYNIIKFIDQSNIENKIFYSNLLRAQLSIDELILLFYNCTSNMGSEKFKPLIEKYALLKGLPKEMLINTKNYQSFYDNSAFGK